MTCLPKSLVVFSMFFSGGLIPTYLLVSFLRLTGTVFEHGGIDGLQHSRGIAAGVVAVKNGALQSMLYKVARGAEYGRVGAAKTVNVLLGVAHNEYAGRLPRAGIARQARMNRMVATRLRLCSPHASKGTR